MPPRPPLLVALRALGLGDFLTAVPAYRALARAFPGHRRVLAAPRALHALVPLLDGAIAQAVDARGLEPLAAPLRHADVAVNLHGRGPQSHRVLLAAQPRRLVAFAHSGVPESAGGPCWRAGEHEVRRWCRLLGESGIPADPAQLDIGPPAQSVAAHLRGATVLHPGAASGARRWPAERWIAVALASLQRGERVVLTGSAAERSLTAHIAERCGLRADADLAGRTTLLQLAALIAAAARVVCGDTGVAHLASAYRIPSLVLFGPVAPEEWGPPERPQHRVLWAGRRGNPHAADADPGLLAISAESVCAELVRLAANR